MPIALIVPLSLTMGVVSYALIAAWYVMPRIASWSFASAASPILLLHTFRYVGLAFLVPGVTAAPLDPRFAGPAAWGDLLAALLALAGLLALRGGWRGAVPLVWVFNVVGTLDLVNAVARGLRYTADGDLGATFFIPVVIVPLLLVTHAMLFVLLFRYHRRWPARANP